MVAAIGMIEAEGVASIIAAADAACKAAVVELLGWESIGGFTTVFFRGELSAVGAALKSGEQAALDLVGAVVAAPLTQPEAACLDFIENPLPNSGPQCSGALGLLETRGYGVHVPTNDLMVKTAQVEVFNVLTVHDRVVCSLIRGSEVGSVREALAAGQAAVEGGENLMCTALLPQPFESVWQAFGPSR